VARGRALQKAPQPVKGDEGQVLDPDRSYPAVVMETPVMADPVTAVQSPVSKGNPVN
tara:strand:- start:4133 stop:4303 length:171 start_codon:yes stop_codon:yes gene_type:complete